MQFFQEVQKKFDWTGFNPKLKPFNRRILSILATVFPPVILVWIYLVHEANTAQEYMESVYIVTLGTGIFLSFTNSIFIAKRFFSYFNGIDEFPNERSGNSTSRAIFEKTNELVEKWSKFGIFVMKYVLIPCFIFPKVIVSFFVYFTTDVGNDAFSLPAPIWFPYNWKNPTGYLVTVFLQWFWGAMASLYVGCFSALAFGGFKQAAAYVKIMKNQLHAINKMAKHKKSRKNIYKKLSQFIQTHADAKQLFTAFTDLYEVTLTIVFVAVIIAVCAALLLFQIEISHNETDLIVLLEAVMFGAAALILLFFICELGQRFSNQVDEINDVIIRFEWYSFPSDLKQRILPIIMQIAQQPVVIKCFGNVLCARKQFRKVVKTIYSYFMTLREFL